MHTWQSLLSLHGGIEDIYIYIHIEYTICICECSCLHVYAYVWTEALLSGHVLVCVWYAFLFPSISLHVWICRERHMHTYVSTYIHTCIHTYIYIYGTPPPPPWIYLFRVFGSPTTRKWNGGSLRGGASRWTITILWLGELHPGPIEFSRGPD